MQSVAAMASRSGTSLANVTGNALGNAFEHKHTDKCEGSPVKSTSKPKFARACAKSVLKFAFAVLEEATEESFYEVSRMEQFPHACFTKSCNLQSEWRGN